MTALVVLALSNICLSGAFLWFFHKQEDNYDRERQQWKEERRHLLDRIQAPSYDHLKHHEAKIIKAQKEEPKQTINLEVV